MLGEGSGELLRHIDGDFGGDFAGALLWKGARRVKQGLASAYTLGLQGH